MSGPDHMYLPDRRDREIFGSRYIPPDVFLHGEWHLVARFEKHEADGDGAVVEIDESRLPARFFRLRIVQSGNSVGEQHFTGACIKTGSGDEVGQLLVAIAEQISNGMIGIYPYPEARDQ